MIVSFAWTTKVLLAGHKRCTRRMWNDNYFDQWVYAWRAGRRVHDAYDRQPRFGGHKVGEIRLTCEPYRERLAEMPESDLIEGGDYGKARSNSSNSSAARTWHPSCCALSLSR